MSKGSKRNSAKKNERLFNYFFKPKGKTVQLVLPVYFKMTDEEIDRTFFYLGEADRSRMKKDAAQERLRLTVKAALDKEKQA